MQKYQILFKRISSGAYERVFLGRKDTTGDVYAIKVHPKQNQSSQNHCRKRTFFFNSVIHSQFFTIPSLAKITYIQSWNICQVAIYSHFYKNQGPLDEHSTKIYILLILKCTKISPFKWDYSQRFETRQISSFSMHTLNRNPNLSMLNRIIQQSIKLGIKLVRKTCRKITPENPSENLLIHLNTSSIQLKTKFFFIF